MGRDLLVTPPVVVSEPRPHRIDAVESADLAPEGTKHLVERVALEHQVNYMLDRVERQGVFRSGPRVPQWCGILHVATDLVYDAVGTILGEPTLPPRRGGGRDIALPTPT